MSSANQTTPTLTISGQPARPPSAVFRPPSYWATRRFGLWWADPVIALGIAALAVHEGREAWEGEEDDDD